jgi:hypothetical protein
MAENKPLPKHLQFFIDLLPLNERLHQRVLFEAYGKPTYARRIRKIVSEYGWDIERVRGSDGANDDYYIRRSEGPVRPQRIRKEVAPRVREQVYVRDGWECQICGCDVSREQTANKVQCDHKVPAERGGSSDKSNLQTVCVTCNLKKRQACRTCSLPSCASCEFAFPERLAAVLVLSLGDATWCCVAVR